MIFDDNEIQVASRDLLDREPVAKALIEMLNADGVDTPLTFGILGGWGTGKSSLMYMMKEQIQHNQRVPGVKDVFVWFDTWAYARQEQSLWRALLLAVVNQLKGSEGLGKTDASKEDVEEWDQKLEELEASLYRAQTLTRTGEMKVNWGHALPLAADLALRFATAGVSDAASGGGFFKRIVSGLKDGDAKEAMQLIERESEERYVAEVKALDDFRQAFKNVLESAGIGRAKRRLVVFVDDLDRCLPEDALAAIEAIKLFLYEEGCVFVLGMDPAVVERGVGVRYEKIMDKESDDAFSLTFDPADYLDKVIQVPFRIPPLAPDQVDRLLTALAAQDKEGIIEETRELLLASVPANPRTLKRVLNVLLLFHKLQPNLRHDETQRVLLAKLVLMQVLFRRAYQLLYEHGESVLSQLEGRDTLAPAVSELVEKMTGLKEMMEKRPHFKDIDEGTMRALINMAEQTTTSTRPETKT